MNTLQKEREQKSLTDKYPWLDPDDERKHMTDREILEKYINLNNLCLDKEEKIKVMDMLFKYRENSKRYSGILPYFSSSSYSYQRMPMGLKISPSIWQSYINAILDYPLKGDTHEQIRRPIKSFIKEWIEDITKEVSII